MQASEMHIPNAKCHLIVTRIFSLKVDFETVLDLVFQTLGKHFIKVNFSKCSVKNSTQIGGPTLHICPGPRGFLECGTCGRKTRKILGKLGWWVIPIPWIKLCFQDRVKASRLVIGLVWKIFYCSISLLLPDEKPMKPTLCNWSSESEPINRSSVEHEGTQEQTTLISWPFCLELSASWRNRV